MLVLWALSGQHAQPLPSQSLRTWSSRVEAWRRQRLLEQDAPETLLPSSLRKSQSKWLSIPGRLWQLHLSYKCWIALLRMTTLQEFVLFRQLLLENLNLILNVLRLLSIESQTF